MKPLILIIAIAPLIASARSSQECIGAPSAPALDHVVIVVQDLDEASARFQTHGFRLKPGRLHANNLLNRHIKFRDGTSLELMTVLGEPRDAMAEDYHELAAGGEGGVYVALNVPSTAGPLRVASALGLEVRQSASGPWQFVSFAPASPAAAVFFSAGAAPVQDPDSLVSHQPDVTGLAEAWIEGGSELIALLENLGAKRCGPTRSPEGRTGERLGLSHGSVVVAPPRTSFRPRVLGVVLQLRSPGDHIAWPHPQLWVDYRFHRP